MTKMQKFAGVYSKFKEIEDNRDLAKQKLRLADYYTLFDVLKTMSDCKTPGITFNTSVAEWCKRNKLSIIMDNDKVNYVITL